MQTGRKVEILLLILLASVLIGLLTMTVNAATGANVLNNTLSNNTNSVITNTGKKLENKVNEPAKPVNAATPEKAITDKAEKEEEKIVETPSERIDNSQNEVKTDTPQEEIEICEAPFENA